jgi:hypothetical protein
MESGHAQRDRKFSWISARGSFTLDPKSGQVIRLTVLLTSVLNLIATASKSLSTTATVSSSENPLSQRAHFALRLLQENPTTENDRRRIGCTGSIVFDNCRENQNSAFPLSHVLMVSSQGLSLNSRILRYIITHQLDLFLTPTYTDQTGGHHPSLVACSRFDS